MSKRIIDLSIPIDPEVRSDPETMQPQISYSDHVSGFPMMQRFFPGLQITDLPDCAAWAAETLTLSTHNGTHMDAPYHFHPTQDAALEGGKRKAWTIDETPLDWCYRPGVKLDFRRLPDGYVVSAEDVEKELARIAYTLQPLDIVLVNTRAGALYGNPDYHHSGCGVGREATLYLTERGVRVVGTDAWSWDAPFVHTAKRYAESKDPTIIWEGHKAGRDIGYFQMEKLHNLDALPAHGFEVICFPVKIKAASAGWTRCVALLGGESGG